MLEGIFRDMLIFIGAGVEYIVIKMCAGIRIGILRSF